MQFLIVLATMFALNVQAAESKFFECFDHGNGGAMPQGAPTLYQIKRPSGGFPYIVPTTERKVGSAPVFKLIVEDVRFTNYKCWDKNKNFTGFDAEMMTLAASAAGYRFIQFVPRAWTDVIVDGKKRLSLLVDLNNGLGDAVSAGMSITSERQEIANMIGPIYKAGKKLMARKDNPKISAQKLQDMMTTPQAGYDSLRGLSVLVVGSDIRGAFFRKLNETQPGLITYLTANSSGNGFESVPNEESKLLVYEISDWAVLNDFIDRRLNTLILGRKFDLVMVDTGSTKSLEEEGKLGIETQIVSGNLSADPNLGVVFGLGDGVSFRADDQRADVFVRVLAKMVCAGWINQKIERWFKDQNAADHSWAQCQ